MGQQTDPSRTMAELSMVCNIIVTLFDKLQSKDTEKCRSIVLYYSKILDHNYFLILISMPHVLFPLILRVCRYIVSTHMTRTEHHGSPGVLNQYTKATGIKWWKRAHFLWINGCYI